MAKSTRDDSLLLKSAESLGRIIGALQRQLDGATGARKPRARKAGAAASRKGTKSKAAAGKGLARKAARPR
ncbi:MAG: hypothetical protein AB7P99_07625 [Vicinamibacterales bacterium]